MDKALFPVVALLVKMIVPWLTSCRLKVLVVVPSADRPKTMVPVLRSVFVPSTVKDPWPGAPPPATLQAVIVPALVTGTSFEKKSPHSRPPDWIVLVEALENAPVMISMSAAPAVMLKPSLTIPLLLSVRLFTRTVDVLVLDLPIVRVPWFPITAVPVTAMNELLRKSVCLEATLLEMTKPAMVTELLSWVIVRSDVMAFVNHAVSVLPGALGVQFAPVAQSPLLFKFHALF